MRGTRFVTLDVFTDTRFGGNPLAVFPDADHLSGDDMQAIAREFNMSEVVFVQTPSHAENTARVRIFTSEMEIGFAGHPNVGAGWVLANEGRGNGTIRLEQSAGLVEVAVEREGGTVRSCRIGAPQPLKLSEPPTREEIAACAGLDLAELGNVSLASVALATVCVAVSQEALARAECNPAAFKAIGLRRPELAKICLLYLYVDGPEHIRSRLFAPSSGTIEDPATGSAACALTGMLLHKRGGESLELEIVQGVEMGRPSRMRTEARREGSDIRAWVGGGCVPVLKGEML